MRGFAPYNGRMIKTLLIIAVLGFGAWYLMGRAKQNAAVQQMQQAPEKYVKSLQNDVERAKQTADAASKAIDQKSDEINKELEKAR